jgi:hypothetical protein
MPRKLWIWVHESSGLDVRTLSEVSFKTVTTIRPTACVSLTKSYKQGSTLPIKFQLCDANGIKVTTATASLAVYKVSNAMDTGDPVVVLDSGSSNDNGLYFRVADGQYIYNLRTKNQTQGTCRILISLNDGTQIIIYYELKSRAQTPLFLFSFSSITE